MSRSCWKLRSFMNFLTFYLKDRSLVSSRGTLLLCIGTFYQLIGFRDGLLYIVVYCISYPSLCCGYVVMGTWSPFNEWGWVVVVGSCIEEGTCCVVLLTWVE